VSQLLNRAPCFVDRSDIEDGLDNLATRLMRASARREPDPQRTVSDRADGSAAVQSDGIGDARVCWSMLTTHGTSDPDHATVDHQSRGALDPAVVVDGRHELVRLRIDARDHAG